MANQINKKNNQNKAIASLVLGAIGLIISLGHIYNLLEGWTIDSFKMPEIFKFAGQIVKPFGGELSYTFLSLLTPVIGLILGIFGLKSTKRNIAKGGIILSVIGLFGVIIFFLLALGFATGM